MSENDSVIVKLSDGSVDFQGAEVSQEVRELAQEMNGTSSEQIKAAFPMGSMKTFAENHPVFVEAVRKVGTSCADADAAHREFQEEFQRSVWTEPNA